MVNLAYMFVCVHMYTCIHNMHVRERHTERKPRKWRRYTVNIITNIIYLRICGFIHHGTHSRKVTEAYKIKSLSKYLYPSVITKTYSEINITQIKSDKPQSGV